MPGGVLSVKSKLDDAAVTRLKAAWVQHQEGLRNKFKTAVLDMDATWTPMAATGVDSQHLETRRFQIEEICRAMRVFPQMVGHTDKTATFASAEAFFLAHVIHSLMPWIRRWEEKIDATLLADVKEDNLAAYFNVRALLRGDATSTSNYYKAALGAGNAPAWMTQDEVRDCEGLNPMGGDAAKLPERQAAPAPQPAKDPASDPAQERASRQRGPTGTRQLMIESKVTGFAYEFKEAKGAGYFEGYGSVFGNIDSYGDMVAKGAFTSTLAEHAAAKTMPKMLLNHGGLASFMGPAPQDLIPVGKWTGHVGGRPRPPHVAASSSTSTPSPASASTAR